MATDFQKVQDWFSSRVESVSGDPYARRNGSKFKLSSVPLTTIEDPSSLQHLLYNVWIESAPNTGLNRGRDTIDERDGTIWIEARVLVQFTFHLRVRTQVESQRLAGHAAAAVVRGIMGAQSQLELDAFGCISADLVDGMRPSLTPDGHWVLIEQEYIAGLDLMVRPPTC